MTAPDEPARIGARQEELDHDQLLADLSQAVADRDQGASDHDQGETDRDRADLACGPEAGGPTDASGGLKVSEAQERRDAHQQVLDDAQSARALEQLTLEAQQDLLDVAAVPEPLAVAMRRFEAAETRAAASELRAEAAIRRARAARARAAEIARLGVIPD